MCLLKVKIRILWKIFEVILKELDLKSQHITLFIFWEAWYLTSQLKLTRLLIPFTTFKIAELFTFYVKIIQKLTLPEVKWKKGKSENNWGSFDCGKIFYWNKIPVIAYCAALTRSSEGKGGEWRQFSTKLSPSENQQSFLQAGKNLLNALAVSRLWFALGIPRGKCRCANRRVLHSCVALGTPCRGCGICLGKQGCVLVFMCSCFCMTAVGRAVLGAVAERGGAAGGAAPGGVRGSTAGRALDVSTAPSLLHRIGCVRECQCPSANILH